ncbi:PH domain-containing protein [Phthorimaea operculella]|nr:PH domain-containing protein [Phthorimaea operculella]
MSDAIVPKGQPIPGDPEKKGWLFKWTNYLKGYQRRWFVLSNGLLSYYRNQAEMAHTCRGTISLLGALIHTADSCTFVISNGGTQTFHIRAHDEVERQSWVTALELAKAKAIRAQESDDDEENMNTGAVAMPGEEGEDAGGIARELAARFHDLRTCSELVARHGAALQRALVDLEAPPTDNTKQVSERATLFRISCNAMMNACSEFMSAAAASSARMSRALQHEREQKMRLQEVVEQLARQHDNLEKTVTGRGTSHAGGNGTSPGHETEDEDHEFFDAQEEGISASLDDKTSFVIKVPVNRKQASKASKTGTDSDESEGEQLVTETQQVSEVSQASEASKTGTDSDESEGEQLVTETQQVSVCVQVSEVSQASEASKTGTDSDESEGEQLVTETQQVSEVSQASEASKTGTDSDESEGEQLVTETQQVSVCVQVSEVSQASEASKTGTDSDESEGEQLVTETQQVSVCVCVQVSEVSQASEASKTGTDSDESEGEQLVTETQQVSEVSQASEASKTGTDADESEGEQLVTETQQLSG